MATQRDIARFFQVALRLRLIDTAAIEPWVDSVIAANTVAQFPFTELAGTSRISSTSADELLGKVTGHGDTHLPGRMVMALLRRRWRDGSLTAEAAIRLSLEIATLAPLARDEHSKADRLEDSLSLATSGTYGTLDDVKREIAEFLDSYARFEEHIPPAFKQRTG